MMRHTTTLLMLLTAGASGTLPAQRIVAPRYSAGSTRATAMTPPRDPWGRDAVHFGKWLTAAGAAALTVFAEREHRQSRRNWDALLTICRSADDACAVGSDARYLRSDAEQLYQRSRVFDRRANRWLLGAQATLLVTTALFIIDLHPGRGPGNIPFSPLRVGLSTTADGAAVGLRLSF